MNANLLATVVGRRLSMPGDRPTHRNTDQITGRTMTAKRPIFGTTVIALFIVGCTSGSAATPSATSPTSDTRPSPIASMAAATSADPKGDLHNPEGKKIKSPAYVDVLRLGAAASGGEFTFRAELAGLIPPASTLTQTLNYYWEFETDGAGEVTYSSLVGNLESGRFTGDVTDWTAGHAYSGNKFPGRITVDGPTVTLSLPATALGSPDVVRYHLVTQATDANGDVTAEDVAPNGKSNLVDGSWLTVTAS